MRYTVIQFCPDCKKITKNMIFKVVIHYVKNTQVNHYICKCGHKYAVTYEDYINSNNS